MGSTRDDHLTEPPKGYTMSDRNSQYVTIVDCPPEHARQVRDLLDEYEFAPEFIEYNGEVLETENRLWLNIEYMVPEGSVRDLIDDLAPALAEVPGVVFHGHECECYEFPAHRVAHRPELGLWIHAGHPDGQVTFTLAEVEEIVAAHESEDYDTYSRLTGQAWKHPVYDSDDTSVRALVLGPVPGPVDDSGDADHAEEG